MEAVQWGEYVKKHGSLNVCDRLEYGFALIAMMIDNKTGGKHDMKYFMPHAKAAEREITLEEAMEAWG